MNINEIIAIVREYIDEPAADAATGDWSDSDLILYINMEHRHCFSIIRKQSEDWFMRKQAFPLVSNQIEYELNENVVHVRRVEFINADSVSSYLVNLVVNEQLANPQEVSPTQLNAKEGGSFLATTSRFRALEQYFFDDSILTFTNGTNITPSRYARIYYLPSAPDLHRGTAQAGGANTITLSVGTSSDTNLLGRVYGVTNYYQRMRVEIISGTGAGQQNRIAHYDGATKIATMTAAWGTAPDATSVYSIVSPMIEDYQELLALGAAMRAKGLKVEDDTSVLGQMYGAIMDDMTDSLDVRIHQGPRRTISTNRAGQWA